MALQSAMCRNGRASRARGSFGDVYDCIAGPGAIVTADTWMHLRGTRGVLKKTSERPGVGSWRAWSTSAHDALLCITLISHARDTCTASGSDGVCGTPKSVLTELI